MKKDKSPLIINSIIIIVLLALMVYLTIKYWPLINDLKDESTREAFKTWIQNRGFLGLLIIIGIQVFQIVVAFIPGQIVEIVIGMMYGPFWGTLVCLIGVVIAIVIIYVLVSWLGKPFQRLFLSEKNEKKYAFLNNTSQVSAAFFFIFLLPAVPKDALIYLGQPLKVKLSVFIMISVVGRFPGLLLTTIMGKYLVNNNITATIITAVICVVIAGAGIIFNKKIITILSRLLEPKKEEVQKDEK